MEKLPRQKYTKEFREQAVRLVIEQELTIPEAARRLSMSGQTLSNWVFKARHGKLAEMDAHRKPVTDLDAENSQLKRELAEARMERDILKKATAYFAKASLPGTRS
jgi:transposase